MARTIIVGAGINGLLLGALLAHDGDEVVVFEKRSFTGGRAFLLEKEGFILDNGIHLTRFGPHSALARIMNAIERPVAFTGMGPSHVLDERGKLSVFPTGLGSILSTDLFTFTEKLRIIPLILKIRKGGFHEGLMNTSLREWMNGMRITGGIRRYFELVSASLMVCPFIEHTSVGEMLAAMSLVLKRGHSVEYLTGGWKPVFASLEEEIERRGTIHRSTTVTGILMKGNSVTGVNAAGKKYTADRVVLNLPVQEIFSLMPASRFDPEYVKRCKTMLPTSGIFFDIALRRRIADYSGLLYTSDPLTYGLITSNLEEKVAPPGRQLMTFLYPVSMKDAKDRQMVKKRKEELWVAIKKYFPRIEDDVLWKRESVLSMVDGVQVNTAQYEKLRPGHAVPGVKNLFLVGDSLSAPGAGGDVGNESVIGAFALMTGKLIK